MQARAPVVPAERGENRRQRGNKIAARARRERADGNNFGAPIEISNHETAFDKQPRGEARHNFADRARTCRALEPPSSRTVGS